MPKKTFKNELNPALQFISTESETSQTQKNQKTQKNQENQNPDPNPVPMKRNPLYIETKSKRFQMLMQPSLYDKLKDMADRKNISLNLLIHTLLEQSVKKNR